MLKTAKYPFRFHIRLHLTELTGLKAADLQQLARLIKVVPGASIYHHTHRFLQIHQYLSPEPPNDFAYWVGRALGDDELSEKLVSMDIMRYATIRSLRENTVETIEEHIKNNPSARRRFAMPGDEFHFMKSVSFILPTNYSVYTLEEFSRVLAKITIDSIYFHIFEARLRLEKETNDFSYWIETSLENKGLADEIARLDPYTRTMEDLRRVIIEKIERGM